MRPSWSGLISFGLVNIPVSLFPATEDKDPHFHLLHKEDEGNVRYQKVCSVCGNVLGADDLIKGFEYDKGSYVSLTDDELNGVSVKSSENIEIQDFVDPAEIDPIFYERPYFVEPTKKAGKAYALLHDAMLKSGRVGLAKVTFRNRERLAAIRATKDGLMMVTMHFADELRDADQLPAITAEVGDRELQMANMLIDTMTAKFDPTRYKDTYSEALRHMIDDKLAGRRPEHAELKTEPTNVIDLIDYLKKSIEKSGKQVPPAEEVQKQPSRRRAKAA